MRLIVCGKSLFIMLFYDFVRDDEEEIEIFFGICFVIQIIDCFIKKI
jgi:hypothetical protein